MKGLREYRQSVMIDSMNIDLSSFNSTFWMRSGLATLVMVAVLLLAKMLTARYIRNAERNWSSQQRLRWIGYVRNLFFGMLLFGVIYIWGEAIHGFAVSVFAIAFAVVYSVKEMFMCFNGTFLKFRGNTFEIGDRIMIGDIRGDVIASTLLTTTLLEIGRGAANHQMTGRKVVIPNSMFLDRPIMNESFLENYFINNITIPLKITDDWKRAKEVLLKIAHDECAPYLEQARRLIRKMERTRALELPCVEPKVSILMPTPDMLHLHLRIPSPMHLKERLEQVVITHFLDQFFSQEKAPLETLSDLENADKA